MMTSAAYWWVETKAPKDAEWALYVSANSEADALGQCRYERKNGADGWKFRARLYDKSGLEAARARDRLADKTQTP